MIGFGALRWAARLVLLMVAQPLAAADESLDIDTSVNGDTGQTTGVTPNQVDDMAAADAASAALDSLAAEKGSAGGIKWIKELEGTTIALTMLIAIGVFAGVSRLFMGQRNVEAEAEAEEEAKEEEEAEEAEEAEGEGESKKEDDSGTSAVAPEAAKNTSISEPELLRKFDRLPMWTIVDGRARPLALEDGKPHFWVDFDEALAKVEAVRKAASLDKIGEIMLRVVGMGQALAIASQGGVVERRKADVEFAKTLPCKDSVDWEKSSGLLPLFVCHGMLQVMPDGKRVQPIFLRGEDAQGAMDAAKKANAGKESALELRAVALQRMAQLLLTGMIPDPDYIRFVPSSRSIQAIRDLEEAKEKSDEQEKNKPKDPDDDPPPLE